MTAADTAIWRLSWAHGEAEVQSLGGMLGPVTFKLADGRDFQPLQVAPWADAAMAADLPGILRRLRGEWPCVPFGRSDRPAALPMGWDRPQPAALAEDELWGHGYGAHHHWRLEKQLAHCLHLAIDYPSAAPIARLEREIRVTPHRPELDITLTIFARRAVVLPVALHPTFRLPRTPGTLTLERIDFDRAITYPVPAEPDVSHLTADAVSRELAAMPAADGQLDLTQLPLDVTTEELLQLKNCRSPIVLHYRDENARVSLSWDQRQLPDVMLWLSNGGRSAAPWNGRHYALGIEPVNGPFDLGQVATPPAGHPLAGRRGIALSVEQPCVIRARLTAW